MPHTIELSSLTPREAVADALYRCVYALDLNDQALWESSWAKNPDVSFSIEDQKFDGRGAIDGLFAHVGPLATQHINTNIRVEIKEGGKEALMTAYYQNQHFRAGEGLTPGAPNFIGGGHYSIDLVKEDGEEIWRIQTWRMHPIWTQGDRAIIASP